MSSAFRRVRGYFARRHSARLHLAGKRSIGAEQPASCHGGCAPAEAQSCDPLSIGPLIAVCCQATILPLSSDTPVAIAPSELVRLRRRSDRGWRDDCLAGLAIDVVGGFSGLS
jgi:hypothetical protein